jgi:ribonuclease R
VPKPRPKEQNASQTRPCRPPFAPADPRLHQQSGLPAGKREIARAFGLHGADKIDAQRPLLKDMADEA